MTAVTKQTEDLFVNGKFSQIIFIPIVWLRREGWHQEAKIQGQAMLFNILLYCHIKQCHTPEMPVIVIETKIAEQLDINIKIRMSIIQMSNSHK